MSTGLRVVYIGRGKGRGVIATRFFKRGDTVEIAPILVVFGGFDALGDQEDLSRYELKWGRKVAIAGGLAHFYNHSDTPNIRFIRDLRLGQITVKALRSIAPREELCHRYAIAPWWEA